MIPHVVYVLLRTNEKGWCIYQFVIKALYCCAMVHGKAAPFFLVNFYFLYVLDIDVSRNGNNLKLKVKPGFFLFGFN